MEDITEDMIKSQLKFVYFNSFFLINFNKDCSELMHICGQKVFVKNEDIINGRLKCICTKQSRNELLTSNYLQYNNIPFKREISFSNLRTSDNELLYYDYGLFKDEKLIVLVELDGRQHFEVVFGEKAFEATKQNDTIKNSFAKSNKIPLVRINYTQNLEQELFRIINKYYFNNSSNPIDCKINSKKNNSAYITSYNKPTTDNKITPSLAIHKTIEKYLTTSKIHFNENQSFIGLYDMHKLRYNFEIHKNKKIGLIQISPRLTTEYGIDSFFTAMKHFTQKVQYANNNNIKILIILPTDKDIIDKVENFVRKL